MCAEVRQEVLRLRRSPTEMMVAEVAPLQAAFPLQLGRLKALRDIT